MVKRNFMKNFQKIAIFGRFFFSKKNSHYFWRIWVDFWLSSFEITIFKLVGFIVLHHHVKGFLKILTSLFVIMHFLSSPPK